MSERGKFCLMRAGTLGAVIMTTVALPNLAHADRKSCDKTQKSCLARCEKVFERADRVLACKKRCDSSFSTCIINLPTGSGTKIDPGRPPQTKAGGIRVPRGGILEPTLGFPSQGPATTGNPIPRAPSGGGVVIR